MIWHNYCFNSFLLKAGTYRNLLSPCLGRCGHVVAKPHPSHNLIPTITKKNRMEEEEEGEGEGGKMIRNETERRSCQP